MNELLNNYKIYLNNIHRSLVYYNYMRPFIKYLSDNKLDFKSLNKEELAKYFNFKKYSAQAINSVIKGGRDFCKFLNIPENAFKTIPLLKTERRIPNYLTEKDIQKAIGYILTYNNRLHLTKLEALIYFLFFTGCRKGELLLLHRKDIDMEECSVKVYGEKTKTERMVYFNTKLKHRLEKYFFQEKEETNLFNITKAQLDYMVGLIEKYIPNKHITPHTLRHSFARNLVEKGVPIGIISKQLGHKSISTTMIYTEADDDMVKRIMREKMNKKDDINGKEK